MTRMYLALYSSFSCRRSSHRFRVGRRRRSRVREKRKSNSKASVLRAIKASSQTRKRTIFSILISKFIDLNRYFFSNRYDIDIDKNIDIESINRYGYRYRCSLIIMYQKSYILKNIGRVICTKRNQYFWEYKASSIC